MLCFANMNYKGLVDPRDKPFGRSLLFEVQVKIMFWVECFNTMDKRKKLQRDLLEQWLRYLNVFQVKPKTMVYCRNL